MEKNRITTTKNKEDVSGSGQVELSYKGSHHIISGVEKGEVILIYCLLWRYHI